MARNSIFRGQEFNLFWRGLPLVLLAGLVRVCRQPVPGKHSRSQSKSGARGQHSGLAAEPEKGFQNFSSDQPKSFCQGTKGWGGTEKCPSLLFHVSLFRFQSLERKVEGTKGQAGPTPSFFCSPAVKESRICIIQITLFFLFFWRDFDTHFPIHFTRGSQKPSAGHSGNEPPVKASWSPGETNIDSLQAIWRWIGSLGLEKWAQSHSDRTANHTWLPDTLGTCPIDFMIAWEC